MAALDGTLIRLRRGRYLPRLRTLVPSIGTKAVQSSQPLVGGIDVSEARPHLEALRTAVRAFVAGRVPSRDLDDVIQDTLTIAWRKGGPSKPGTRYETWVLGIAKFVIRRYFDRQSSLEQLGLDDYLESTSYDPNVSTIEGLASVDLALKLRNIIRLVCTPKEASALEFRAIEEASFASLEAATRINQKTLSSHYSRGRGKLLEHIFLHERELLPPDFEEATLKATPLLSRSERFALTSPKGRAKDLRSALIKIFKFCRVDVCALLFMEVLLR